MPPPARRRLPGALRGVRRRPRRAGVGRGRYARPAAGGLTGGPATVAGGMWPGPRKGLVGPRGWGRRLRRLALRGRGRARAGPLNIRPSGSRGHRVGGCASMLSPPSTRCRRARARRPRARARRVEPLHAAPRPARGGRLPGPCARPARLRAERQVAARPHPGIRGRARGLDGGRGPVPGGLGWQLARFWTPIDRPTCGPREFSRPSCGRAGSGGLGRARARDAAHVVLLGPAAGRASRPGLCPRRVDDAPCRHRFCSVPGCMAGIIRLHA